MEKTATFKLLEKTIKAKKVKTQKYIEDMQHKLDVYFANDRITAEEYEELLKLLEE